ncbi:biliverdin-producing heme oxygenase [Pseudomonas guariconensis]|uniref:Biliverdin-producing heme oxygenase n=1 Tax=Pseudomonas guariconensis TaxID=1288410 RepID=A0AAX0VS09_9PSED|nr:biliverdin-producing heme oxygenase [Pseudomonas guariconensis]PLV16512.1 biliverdin-producing heme oxygenase [Pseudomonas guariconensis]PLV22151.1 biliverdin-producing heme oxygenase [Pseudomonas guariconensis]PLV30420.1 biliverdin-producing heme oxygenase [Pseudomonas guariconensis]
MTATPALRSQRLNQVTHTPHTELDALVKSHKPFDSRESFARFVVAQYLFQSELQALYNDPRLIAIVPDLAQRCRAEQARLDLADLDTDVPAPLPGALQGPSLGQALGWIFVSEGSKLGAAFLIKRAVALGLSDSFGARHLGEPAGGRAEGWKQFTRILDNLELSAEEDAAAERGAVAAFERFTELLKHAYAADAALA